MIADHHDMEELVAAYVLGALGPEEAHRVRAHLAGCSSCRELARRLGLSAAALPLAVETVPAPPELRNRVLAAVQGIPQTATVRPVGERPARQGAVRAWRWRPAWKGPAVAAAAVIAFALGGGLGLGVGRAAFGTPAAPPAAVAQYTISGSGAMAGSGGRVFDLRREQVTLIQFSGLPTLRTGRVYELWLIDRQGHPQPGAVFAPEPDGSKLLLLGRNLDGLSALAVTDEAGPGGGAAPTKQPELLGKLA